MNMESLRNKFSFPESKQLLPAKWQELLRQEFSVNIACFFE